MANINSNETLSLLYENVPICCIFFDENVNLIDCNNEALALFNVKSKKEFFDNFYLFSPEYQQNGKKSVEYVQEVQARARNGERLVFEWLHIDLEGNYIPAEIILIGIDYNGDKCVCAYCKDLRYIKEIDEKFEESNKRINMMINSAPFAINYWEIIDNKIHMIDCNKQAMDLVGTKDLEYYFYNFINYIPKKQKDNSSFHEKFRELILQTSKTGDTNYYNFELLHEDGHSIPVASTFIKANSDERNIILSYSRNLTYELEVQERHKEADTRMEVMLNATPLSATVWNKNFEIIDTNAMMLDMFKIDCEEKLKDNFFEYSPLYQPSGRLSSEKMTDLLNHTFQNGTAYSEWLFLDETGEKIPSELTFVKVNYNYTETVICYKSDLRNISKSLNMLDTLEKMAYTDELTQIYNRRYFMDLSQRKILVNNNNYSIIFFDLDHFKNVNDTYGHNIGDKILKHICTLVSNSLRHTDIFARYGGEEFLIFANETNHSNILNFANRLRTLVEETPYLTEKETIYVTISIGISHNSSELNKPIESIIDEADKALYLSKNNGRNTVTVY